MSEHGVFDGLEAAVIVHPGTDQTYIGGTSYATHPLQFTFLGKQPRADAPITASMPSTPSSISTAA